MMTKIMLDMPCRCIADVSTKEILPDNRARQRAPNLATA